MAIDQDKKDELNRICDECINSAKTVPASYKQLMDYMIINTPQVVNLLEDLYKRYSNKLNLNNVNPKDFIMDFRKIIFD